jgi:hypothetical protein
MLMVERKRETGLLGLPWPLIGRSLFSLFRTPHYLTPAASRKSTFE